MHDQVHRQMQERIRLSPLKLSSFDLAALFSSSSELLDGFDSPSISRALSSSHSATRLTSSTTPLGCRASSGLEISGLQLSGGRFADSCCAFAIRSLSMYGRLTPSTSVVVILLVRGADDAAWDAADVFWCIVDCGGAMRGGMLKVLKEFEDVERAEVQKMQILLR
jgi:hypothetical protein